MQHFYAAIYASVLCNSVWNSSLCSIFMHFMSPLLTFLLALIYTAVFATTTATITTATSSGLLKIVVIQSCYSQLLSVDQLASWTSYVGPILHFLYCFLSDS